MFVFCTKIYLRNKKVSKLIEKKKKFVDLLDYFPVQLSYGIIIRDGCVNLCVHCSVTDRQKILDENGNFKTLFFKGHKFSVFTMEILS